MHGDAAADHHDKPVDEDKVESQDTDQPTVTANEEVDDFGLRKRPAALRTYERDDSDAESTADLQHETLDLPDTSVKSTDRRTDPKDEDEGAELYPPVGERPSVLVPADSAEDHSDKQIKNASERSHSMSLSGSPEIARKGVSEWSHQQLAPKDDAVEEEEDDGDWQEMPAYATHAIYDDWGKVLAREEAELAEAEAAGTQNLGGAGKGYTKVQLDEDAQSATSMDDDTAYLFKQAGPTNTLDDEEDGRDMMSQMEATKDMLTEGQRIAYVGIIRVCVMDMTTGLEGLEKTKGAKKQIELALEALKMWGQKMMVRLYSHMEIDSSEQIMIEQLAEHGVEAGDLTPALMQNARVKNPVPEEEQKEDIGKSLANSAQPSPSDPRGASSLDQASRPETPATPATPGQAPPSYTEESPPDYLTVRRPSDLAGQKKIDIDLRWTVLCDLFLVLVADSVYDARSRALLERVGAALSIPWIDICRFEKRVTDALEMQQEAEKENWNEEEHMEQREKSARKKRLMVMGLATVGGGLVIGLSAGLLAPVIGAGLAAGFTTIGVAGTSSFLGGAGAAALITSTGAITGSTVGIRAASRRMGAVKTFEYRPLYNSKRVNLIVTISGWMTGKVDDVRLPYSTVDPIMGDIYSVLWEPEMLQSMGQTINILATEALTQTIQQILGSTILTALMGALQLPIVLTKLSYLIDNPWNVSLARADQAGLILADSLIDRNLGSRPITLCGFSIGARVIFSCLKELAKRGVFGVIQNVYMFGSPVVVNKDDYLRAKTIVSGRFVNAYSTNDWILGYLFRATSGGVSRVAGLWSAEIPGIENIDVTELVNGHMAYRAAMPKLMQKVGWKVESLEFSEIEDADPENHDKRQRELINEIEEARRNLEKKPSKRGLRALFSKNKKLAEKKDWETYDERMKASPEGDGNVSPNGQVLFDIDAIQREAAELAAHGIEVREIKSTLPPMQLNVNGQTSSARSSTSDLRSPSSLHHSQSFGSDLPHRTKTLSRTTSVDDYSPREPQTSLSFENSDPPQLSPKRSTTSLSGRPSLHQSRPSLHSASTMPVQGSNLNKEHNAWSDDEELGHEKEEVEMTFE